MIRVESEGGEKMELLWYFLGGFFAWNGIPHLVKGITGQSHMTPFARVSSPVLNVIWAFVNLVIMQFILGLATGSGGFLWAWEANLVGINSWVFLAGGFVCAAYLASFWSNPNARLPWQK
ncbi:hypothetical protein A3E45_03120 [Candidatus Daviesbacteria bacterium RIFCSPHIGHO2_12_FULL_43_11]|uniref:Uncharacterized protein n=2 Tax=Candidatus Daviesiibacteriota TaxID=1752718 RepID=A0A1F5K2N3_9BACT|nr:MAG: hypothetical protein A2874_01570 [Candidatus Daviesbacteria bacterium RIFCSPHIGHO2_01_FULL_43_17]OGE35095.1 MAG: hypothetical protein A3E45_03120 [Candidatus Daviesbacteria bacterium RIFCSPHIGHO2_12_FULL_43_11]OGE70680.1 MAG: hypothetical protein A3J21_02775 [Candidatus Daviesbacteria bacterium RIFCSPLOWO2_02_FULL_43_11]